MNEHAMSETATAIQGQKRGTKEGGVALIPQVIEGVKGGALSKEIGRFPAKTTAARTRSLSAG